MSLADLASTTDPFAGGAQAVEGVIVKGAATRSALVDVAIPSFDTEQAFTGLRWSRDADHLPAAGQSCLVQFTRSGTAWVAAWW